MTCKTLLNYHNQILSDTPLCMLFNIKDNRKACYKRDSCDQYCILDLNNSEIIIFKTIDEIIHSGWRLV
jgi:hypothetical protein